MAKNKTKPLDPEYLGDGIYVHDEGFRLCLAVNHHKNKVIWIEERELTSLIKYAVRAGIIS